MNSIVWHNLCCWSEKQFTSVSWKYKSNNWGKICNHAPGYIYIYQVWQEEWGESVLVSSKLHEILPKLSNK